MTLMKGEGSIFPSSKDPAEIRAVQLENRLYMRIAPYKLETIYNNVYIKFPSNALIARQ